MYQNLNHSYIEDTAKSNYPVMPLMVPHNWSPGPSVAATDGLPGPSMAAIGSPPDHAQMVPLVKSCKSLVRAMHSAMDGFNRSKA